MRTRKRFGQHFLEPVWADKVVKAIAPARDDVFLEIGPGPGILTLKLAPHVSRWSPIEIDRDLIASLSPKLPTNVSIVAGDILEVDLLSTLASVGASTPVRIAGNLPYNISSPILFKLLDLQQKPARVRRQPHASARSGRAGFSRSRARAITACSACSFSGELMSRAYSPFRPAPFGRRQRSNRPSSGSRFGLPRSLSLTSACSSGWFAGCSRSGERRYRMRSRPLATEMGVAASDALREARIDPAPAARDAGDR